MLKRIMLLFVVAAMALFLSGLPEYATAQEKTSCVTCHTNEAIMKSLFKAPKMGGEEGEG